MIKWPITYTDYNGVERTEDFYFGLKKSDLIEMELGTVGTFTQTMEAIIKAKDVPSLIREFKSLIRKSYGIKSADGKRLMKKEEYADAFCETEAYSVLFMDLVTDDEKAAKFVNGILPSDLAQQISNNDSSNDDSSKSAPKLVSDIQAYSEGGQLL